MEESKRTDYNQELLKIQDASTDVHDFIELVTKVKEMGISLDASIEKYMEDIDIKDKDIEFIYNEIKNQEWNKQDPWFEISELKEQVKNTLLEVLLRKDLRIMSLKILLDKAIKLIDESKKNSEYKLKAETQKGAIEWAATFFKGLQEQQSAWMVDQLNKERMRSDKTIERAEKLSEDLSKLKESVASQKLEEKPENKDEIKIKEQVEPKVESIKKEVPASLEDLPPFEVTDLRKPKKQDKPVEEKSNDTGKKQLSKEEVAEKQKKFKKKMGFI